ncbi:MAG: alpha/beta fold hydrolase [Candidatus Limnocylindrales bacterium]
MEVRTNGDYLEVESGRLYYEVAGDGHPLTLIHAGVADLRMWDDQVPELARHHRVVRYDTRGFGRTRSEDASFSNRDDLQRLWDHLGLDSSHLLGLSRGASIALDVTLEMPQRVSSLVFCSSSPGGFELDVPESAATWAEMERLWEAREWPRLVELEARMWVDGPGQPEDRVAPDVRARMIGWMTENYVNGPGEGRPRPLEPPAVGRLDEVIVPTLVMWGDLDEPSVRAGSELMVRGIADARQHVFADTAHMLNLEHPTEFTTRVLDFLASVRSSQ